MGLDLDKAKAGRGGGKCAVDPKLDAEFIIRVSVVRKADKVTIGSRQLQVSKDHVQDVFGKIEKTLP